MSFLARTRFTLTPAISIKMRMFSNGPAGWDKDSGSSGSIREAGGAFGKMEAAREDEFFYNKQREQLQKIKDHLEKEISFHEDQIKRHEEAIRRHKEHVDGMSHGHN